MRRRDLHVRFVPKADIGPPHSITSSARNSALAHPVFGILRLRVAPIMPASAIIVSTAPKPPRAKAIAPPATPTLPPRKVQALTIPEPCPVCAGDRADSASRGAEA